MESRLQQGDERNDSFVVAIRPSQDLKPGIVSGQQDAKAEESRHDRRIRCDAKDIPQVSLAQRIREQEGR